MENEKEYFVDIDGYVGLYKCSNYGRIMSVLRKNKKILKAGVTNGGYAYVILCNEKIKKFYTVHSIVAKCFLGHSTENKNLNINHIDGNKLNNKLSNLNICTPRENVSIHFRKNSNKFTSKYAGVSWVKKNKKWTSRIYINGIDNYLGLFENEIDAHIAYQKQLSKILQAKNRNTQQ